MSKLVVSINKNNCNNDPKEAKLKVASFLYQEGFVDTGLFTLSPASSFKIVGVYQNEKPWTENIEDLNFLFNFNYNNVLDHIKLATENYQYIKYDGQFDKDINNCLLVIVEYLD